MPKGRRSISDKEIEIRKDRTRENGKRIDYLEKLAQDETDEQAKQDLETKINSLVTESVVLSLEIDGFRDFQQSQGNHAEITKLVGKLEGAATRVENLLKTVADQAKNIVDQTKQIQGMKTLLEENKTKVGEIHKNIHDYVTETYPNGEALNIGLHGGGLVLSLAGLAFGIACLVYAVNGADDTKTTPAFKESSNSASLEMDVVALDEIPRDPKDMSEDQLEELMQKLMVDRDVIASGKVPQKRLWQNLAGVADKTEIGDQDLALVLLQESAADLPGTVEFLWLDAREAKERYDALRDAYKTSKKLSDVYLAATKIEYDGEEVPTFHTALLLQCALKAIHHDSLFPDTPTPAVA
jgi:hypothetical protein